MRIDTPQLNTSSPSAIGQVWTATDTLGNGLWQNGANPYKYSGVYNLPTITDNGNGTITLGSGTYHFYSDTSYTSLGEYVVAGGTYSFNDNQTSYVVGNYNSGTPIIEVRTSVIGLNNSTVIPILTVYREGNDLDILNWDEQGKALPEKLLGRLMNTERFVVVPGGLMLGEVATRRVTTSAGTVWYGATSTNLLATNSTTDTLVLYYHSAGVWTETDITQYNNSQYDNGTSLQSLTGSHYAVNWIFRDIDGVHKECYVVLGGGNYTLAQAQASTIPTNLPSAITAASIFVGRIIVGQGATTATQIDSAFTTQLGTSPTTAPGDGNTSVQFNDNGVFGGDATNFNYNKTTFALTAGSFVKTGGTPSQFLKADGSVDSSTYLSTTSASTTYVPYSGATGNVDLNSKTLKTTGSIENPTYYFNPAHTIVMKYDGQYSPRIAFDATFNSDSYGNSMVVDYQEHLTGSYAGSGTTNSIFQIGKSGSYGFQFLGLNQGYGSTTLEAVGGASAFSPTNAAGGWMLSAANGGNMMFKAQGGNFTWVGGAQLMKLSSVGTLWTKGTEENFGAFGLNGMTRLEGSSTDRSRLFLANDNLSGSTSAAIHFLGTDGTGYGTLESKYELGNDLYKDGTQTFYLWDSKSSTPVWQANSSGFGIGNLTSSLTWPFELRVGSDHLLTMSYNGNDGAQIWSGNLDKTANKTLIFSSTRLIYYYNNMNDGQGCEWYSAGNKVMEVTSTGVMKVPNMPTSDPADGTHTLWYDTSSRIVYMGT